MRIVLLVAILSVLVGCSSYSNENATALRDQIRNQIEQQCVATRDSKPEFKNLTDDQFHAFCSCFSSSWVKRFSDDQMLASTGDGGSTWAMSQVSGETGSFEKLTTACVRPRMN